MSGIQILRDEVHFGASLTLRLERILRQQNGSEAPACDDGVGFFPLHAWGEPGRTGSLVPGRRASVFIYVGQQEAVRLSLTGRSWKPTAVKIGYGEVNALTGTRWWLPPSDGPRDYLVCPPESELAAGFVAPETRGQFVGIPAGPGEKVAGSVRLRVAVFEPKQGIWPDQPDENADFSDEGVISALATLPPKLGAVAGEQPMSVDAQCHAETWDLDSVQQLTVHLLHSEKYRELVGEWPCLTRGRRTWPTAALKDNRALIAE